MQWTLCLCLRDRYYGEEIRRNPIEEERRMAENLGTIERIIRIIAGIGIVILAFVAPNIAWTWAYLGIVPIATGIVGCCPIYALFGISTCTACKPCN